jgi:fructosamine-3-kinase
MLALFGGLSDATAGAYHEVHPLAPGWRDRLALWQLYPLLVHTVLFGGGYASSVDAALRRHA